MPKKKSNAVQIQDDLDLDVGAPATEQIPEAASDFVTMTSYEREFAETLHEEQRGQRQKDAYVVGRLTNAMKRGEVLTGTIAKIEPGNNTAYWVCYEGPVTIRIPCCESFQNLGANLVAVGRQYVVSQANFLAKSIGATISYVITSIQGNIAVGSRKQALEKIQRRYFGAEAARPVQVGDEIDAQFISVGDHAAFINAYGKDVRIHKADITYRYLPQVNSEFRPGDTLRVRVTAVGTDENGETTLKLSGAAAEEADFPLYYNRVERGHTCSAIVKTIQAIKQGNTGESKLLITLWLEGVNLPAFSSTTILSLRHKLESGDRVLFRMNGLTERGMVHGAIIRYTN